MSNSSNSTRTVLPSNVVVVEAPQFMTVSEVAKVFRVCVHTVRSWITAGKLPAKRFGLLYKIDRKHVEAMLNS